MESLIDEETPEELETAFQRFREFAPTLESALSTQRILKEYKTLVRTKECKGIHTEFENGSNIYVWNIHIDMNKYQISSILNSDFDAYVQRNPGRKKELVFEVRYGQNYPSEPPFVRVIRPRFSFRTGHITIGGSVCIHGLTTSGWNPDRNIDGILMEILSNIAEGHGRLDCYHDRDYTLNEAEIAFRRALRVHGW
ncbi:unnamed protein product [Blepharisma stoltei]|uniref:UBC core domain-containing protein n=1 Tax=Blepharisma stoltei TaxID=1481888 RepID=A0AAU9IZI3_9CILI|nr:unnamed protein product [Blepharisma stoltei]